MDYGVEAASAPSGVTHVTFARASEVSRHGETIAISGCFSPVVGEAANSARLDPSAKGGDMFQDPPLDLTYALRASAEMGEAMASGLSRIRQLAERVSSGTRVQLLWRQGTRQLWLEVREPDMGEALVILVHPEQALDGFRHPYAYAGPHSLRPAGSLVGS